VDRTDLLSRPANPAQEKRRVGPVRPASDNAGYRALKFFQKKLVRFEKNRRNQLMKTKNKNTTPCGEIRLAVGSRTRHPRNCAPGDIRSFAPQRLAGNAGAITRTTAVVAEHGRANLYSPTAIRRRQAVSPTSTPCPLGHGIPRPAKGKSAEKKKQKHENENDGKR
jgi:hypothetical protein